MCCAADRRPTFGSATPPARSPARSPACLPGLAAGWRYHSYYCEPSCHQHALAAEMARHDDAAAHPPPPVAVLCLANNTAITRTFQDLRGRFNMIYRRKAHIHHYVRARRGRGLPPLRIMRASALPELRDRCLLACGADLLAPFGGVARGLTAYTGLPCQTEFMEAAQFDSSLEALDSLISEYASYDGGSKSPMKEPTRVVPVV
jgi:hypothetical protein